MDRLRDRLDSLPVNQTILRAGDRTYDTSRFVETVFRTGNFLRHCGVHESAAVEIVPVPEPETVFGLLGTMLLGGTVSFQTGTSRRPAARLGPTPELNGPEFPAGCKPIGFGSPPGDPSWASFEREVWSENPSFPETDLDPDRPVFAETPTRGLDSLLERAEEIAKGIEPAAEVALRADIADPATVTSGVFAPLVAGATILLPEDDQRGTIAVSCHDCPELRTLDPD